LSVFLPRVFPAQAHGLFFGSIGFGTVALIIIAATRGRLGYDRYVAQSGPCGGPEAVVPNKN
jgi:hypothetical protein